MKQAVQPQPIHIQGVRSQFTRQFPEFLLDLFGNAHIEDPLHQSLNREQMGIDVLQISHRLLKRIRRLLTTSSDGERLG